MKYCFHSNACHYFQYSLSSSYLENMAVIHRQNFSGSKVTIDDERIHSSLASISIYQEGYNNSMFLIVAYRQRK